MSDDEATALVRDAVIREALRWNGGGKPHVGPLPTAGACKVYVSDVERYVRVALAALKASGWRRP